MTGRWKARKSKTTLSLPSHRPLEISPNTVRFPHSHPTADEKIETLLTDSKKPQRDEKCQPCARSVVSTMSPAAQFGSRPSPGFPVELGGFGELHAPFFMERRTRGSFQCSVTGNPGPGLIPICCLFRALTRTLKPLRQLFGQYVLKASPQRLKPDLFKTNLRTG
jgi:hypothetical protein